jgi:hypothetical protein
MGKKVKPAFFPVHDRNPLTPNFFSALVELPPAAAGHSPVAAGRTPSSYYLRNLLVATLLWLPALSCSPCRRREDAALQYLSSLCLKIPAPSVLTVQPTSAPPLPLSTVVRRCCPASAPPSSTRGMAAHETPQVSRTRSMPSNALPTGFGLRGPLPARSPMLLPPSAGSPARLSPPSCLPSLACSPKLQGTACREDDVHTIPRRPMLSSPGRPCALGFAPAARTALVWMLGPNCNSELL